MNKFLNKYKANDYVLLFSAGAAVGTLFLWAASYIFPEGEIVGGRRVFENIPKVPVSYTHLTLPTNREV